MENKRIEQLISMAKKHDLHEIELQEGPDRIRIAFQATPGMRQVVGEQHTAAVAPPSLTDSSVPPAATAKAAPIGKTIRSPFVGTFYRASGPTAEPFVEVGKRVAKGDVLCIVEAMKLMNEIEAEYGCEIVEILVENGLPVEYDQPLFVVR
jgi:acetyl-CoA carboxylase biotin carboxyl carrier protein